jgi:hypothetical protein
MDGSISLIIFEHLNIYSGLHNYSCLIVKGRKAPTAIGHVRPRSGSLPASNNDQSAKMPHHHVGNGHFFNSTTDRLFTATQ